MVLQKEITKTNGHYTFMRNINFPGIKNHSCILYLLRSLALTVIAITIAQCFEFLSNRNITNSIHIYGHNTIVQSPTFHMKYSAMEPVLFEKLPNIELFRSILKSYHVLQFHLIKHLTSIHSRSRRKYTIIVNQVSHKQ